MCSFMTEFCDEGISLECCDIVTSTCSDPSIDPGCSSESYLVVLAQCMAVLNSIAYLDSTEHMYFVVSLS